MSQLSKKEPQTPETKGKLVSPKKPTPTIEEGNKVPIPVGTLTEDRVREIMREEIAGMAIRKINLLNKINADVVKGLHDKKSILDDSTPQIP